MSAKGGVGKSVVAANLAVALRTQTGGEVAIIDGDLQFGDVPVMMRLVPQYTIVDAVDAADRLDAQMLRSLLTRHDLSGVLTLAAPSDPRHAEQIRPDDVVRIAKAMAECCDYVVIDTPPQLNDISLSVMEVSDEVVLVTSADIANVKNVKIALEVLGLIGISEHKAHLVMNRAGSKAKLDLPAVERTLRTRVVVPRAQLGRRPRVGQPGRPRRPARPEVERGQGLRGAGPGDRRGPGQVDALGGLRPRVPEAQQPEVDGMPRADPLRSSTRTPRGVRLALLPVVEVGHDLLDLHAGVGDARPAHPDQVGGPRDLQRQLVDVDGVALEVGQDGLDLRQGVAIGRLVAAITSHPRLPAARTRG